MSDALTKTTNTLASIEPPGWLRRYLPTHDPNYAGAIRLDCHRKFHMTETQRIAMRDGVRAAMGKVTMRSVPIDPVTLRDLIEATKRVTPRGGADELHLVDLVHRAERALGMR